MIYADLTEAFDNVTNYKFISDPNAGKLHPLQKKMICPQPQSEYQTMQPINSEYQTIKPTVKEDYQQAQIRSLIANQEKLYISLEQMNTKYNDMCKYIIMFLSLFIFILFITTLVLLCKM
jgi:hypothetical protein